MTTLRVTYVKPNGADSDCLIGGIGGEGFNLTIDEAISHIENKIHNYYTMVNGQVALIIVERHPRSGRLLLQTSGDTWPENSLVHLTNC